LADGSPQPTEKIGNLGRAAVVGAVVGIFAVTGLMFVLQAFAWGVAKVINNQNAVWVGYIITAGVFFILAALLGFLAYRLVRKGTPPVPKMAIDEAKLVRETLKTPAPEKTV
jgi:hypothetical protein